MDWMLRIRLRALAYLVAIALFALGVISLTTVPAWPVLGVAFACAVVAVNRIAARLDVPVCLQCGTSLDDRAPGEHGIACAQCGAVNQPASDDTAALPATLDGEAPADRVA